MMSLQPIPLIIECHFIPRITPTDLTSNEQPSPSCLALADISDLDNTSEKPAYGEKKFIELQEREINDVAVKVIDDSFVQQFCKEVQIVLQAANDTERVASFSKLKPPVLNNGITSDQIVRFRADFQGRNCSGEYTLGMFGGYKAALVHTEQGQKCRPLIEATIGLFSNVCWIIGVGVAYGKSKESTKLGDVLISEKIAELDTIKYEKKGLIISRGIIGEVKAMLHTLFCKGSNRFVVKKFACTEGTSPRIAKAHHGCIISGSFLVDNKEIKSKLWDNAREAIGGEMEGHVLMDILKQRDPCPFKAIIIKGVCDYGDGTKEKMWQLTAALAAVEYTHFRLEETKGTLFSKTAQTNEATPRFVGEGTAAMVQSDVQSGCTTHMDGQQQPQLDHDHYGAAHLTPLGSLSGDYSTPSGAHPTPPGHSHPFNEGPSSSKRRNDMDSGTQQKGHAPPASKRRKNVTQQKALEISLYELDEKFLAVVRAIQVDCEHLDINLIKTYVTLIPTLMKKEHISFLKEHNQAIAQASCITAIITLLNIYWDCFNYGLLDHLVNLCGCDETKTLMKLFVKEVNTFMKRTILADFMCILRGREEVPPCFSQLIVHHELDPEKTTLHDVDEFRKNLCQQYSLHQVVLIFRSVHSGSVAVVWLIPSHVVEHLCAEMKNPEVGYKVLTQYSVLEVLIDEVRVFVYTSVKDEEDEEKIHEDESDNATYKYEQELSSSAYQRSPDQPVLKHLSAVQNVQHTPTLPHPSPPDVEPDKKPTLTELPPSPDLGHANKSPPESKHKKDPSKVLQENYGTLVDSIQDADTLADRLYTKGVIAGNIKEKVVGYQTAKEKNRVLITAVQQQVGVNPISFQTFIDALNMDKSNESVVSLLTALEEVEQEGTRVVATRQFTATMSTPASTPLPQQSGDHSKVRQRHIERVISLASPTKPKKNRVACDWITFLLLVLAFVAAFFAWNHYTVV